MIIARSPLRITLGGGGTDMPSYYHDYDGFSIAGAIDKYVYVTIMRPFTPGIYLKYSQLEHVEQVDQVQHKIIREALYMQNLRTPQIEITSLADIPSGTGLGSSGSFTTALLKALYAHRCKMIMPHELAELACHIEIDRLSEPIGKQDQYIAAYGGLQYFTFHKAGTVSAEPLNISMQTVFDLEDKLLLFFTGFSRSAGSVLKDQYLRTMQHDDEMLNSLHYVKKLAYQSKEALEAGDLTKFGQLMHEHWEHKRKRSHNMSNSQIDEWYKLAIANGAVGGKLVGAGGGGFLMFLVDDGVKLRHTMNNIGLEEVRFRFDFHGTKILIG
ncbi:MAG: hypothetical protein LBC04_01930 [Holosporaceae bacterium]|jgi:D-glycero-alpha-D-manno-heptose-7-phosphate kinase|nr:hypothetical protein [Holosporaceae bacterium]